MDHFTKDNTSVLGVLVLKLIFLLKNRYRGVEVGGGQGFGAVSGADSRVARS